MTTEAKKQGAKRKWYYRLAAFRVLGVPPDKRTWKELKPLVGNGLADRWKAELAAILGAKNVVEAPPRPQTPPPATPTPRPAPAPRKRDAQAPSTARTIAPTTADAIKAQLAAASVAAAQKAA
jgi:hypothetical protein